MWIFLLKPLKPLSQANLTSFTIHRWIYLPTFSLLLFSIFLWCRKKYPSYVCFEFFMTEISSIDSNSYCFPWSIWNETSSMDGNNSCYPLSIWNPYLICEISILQPSKLSLTALEILQYVGLNVGSSLTLLPENRRQYLENCTFTNRTSRQFLQTNRP